MIDFYYGNFQTLYSYNLLFNKWTVENQNEFNVFGHINKGIF